MATRMKFAVAALFTLVAAAAPAEDWPQWRGPNHDGISQEAIPADLPDKLPIKWTAEVGVGFSGVSVVGDRVFTMGNRTLSNEEKDTVWCLSARDGDEEWIRSYPCALDPLYYEGGPGATPTIAGDAVFTLSKKGHVHRLNLKSGKIEWSRDLVADHQFKLPEWSFAGSPLVDGDRLLLSVGRGGMALDIATGETLWISHPDTPGYATIVPYEAGGPSANRLIFTAKSLIGFNGATGKAAFEFPWTSSRDVNAADPLLVDNRILISSVSGAALIEPRGDKPEVIWEQKDLKWYFNPGVLIDGHVYSISGTTHRPTELTCVDAATGKIVWIEPGFGSGGLIAAGKTIIVFDNGMLTIFDASPGGFKPRLRQKILEGKCWTAPTLANGRIYCRNAAGQLACVAVEAQ